MTQAVAKYAAKKLLSREMDKYKSKDVGSKYDPYYEEIPHPRKPGKTKKVKKQIPSYIPEHDAEILARARKRAYKLDLCLFNFAGIRFGWSSVLGIVPAAGDGLDAAIAVYHLAKMSKVSCGLGKWTFGLMVFNIIVDFFVGLIPFVGDLADAALKCNSKNVRALEERLDEIYKPKELKERDRRSFHPPAPATVYEEFSDEERDLSPERRGGDITPPQAARVPEARRGEPAPQMSSQGRGLFSGGRRERQQDEEMGYGRDDRRHDSRRENRSGRRDRR